ncbi:hypothetical protein ACFYTQ_32760 [Nocardia sp. NPDC004068]|uniref:Rv0361 family membrane protein n=1 Tax=Nocardia sp. NPDC004068 TaxID=3364303 RepID=UPI0036CCA175
MNLPRRGTAPTPVPIQGTPAAQRQAESESDETVRFEAATPGGAGADADRTEKLGTEKAPAPQGKPDTDDSGDPGADTTVRFGAAKAPAPQGEPGEPAKDAATEAIPKPGKRDDRPQPGDDDSKTVALPIVSNPSDAATTILPVQQPGARRPGGPGPVAKPPVTPRPGAGPKNAGPQGPSGPSQGAGPGRQGAAPSPADLKPTVPSQQRPVTPRPIAQPQHIPPAAPPPQPEQSAAKGGLDKRWLIIGGVAIVVVIAIVAAVLGLSGGTDNSPQAQVRAAIGTYTDALADGSLDKLRDSTCGTLHDFYQNIAPDQYAGVHKLAVDQKKIPKIASVDAVQITDEKATAQASVYTDADPNKAVARTFDLQHTPQGWKVCDPPNAAG